MKGYTFSHDFPQSLSIVGEFRYGFAEMKALTGPVVYDKFQMMGRYRASDCRPQAFDHLYRCACGCVLKYDFQPRKMFM